jgi:hypothetical protein
VSVGVEREEMLGPPCPPSLHPASGRTMVLKPNKENNVIVRFWITGMIERFGLSI